MPLLYWRDPDQVGYHGHAVSLPASMTDRGVGAGDPADCLLTVLPCSFLLGGRLVGRLWVGFALLDLENRAMAGSRRRFCSAFGNLSRIVGGKFPAS